MSAFSPEERQSLLAIKGVGPTVLARLEQIGIDCMQQLAESDVDEILASVAAMLGASCWKNSPQARGAIAAAIAHARLRKD